MMKPEKELLVKVLSLIHSHVSVMAKSNNRTENYSHGRDKVQQS
jgi:hypothetical protein